MTKDDLRNLIRNFVKEEVEYHKKDMIKEIKAELFDIIMSSSPPIKSTQNENVNETVKKKTSSVLGKLQNMLNEEWESDDTIRFNSSRVNIPNSNKIMLPDNFEGQLNEKHEEVLEAINRDYSQLMKKLGV